MNQILSIIESSTEEQEKNVERLNEEKEQISSRETEIKNSIRQLENDIAVSGILEKKLADIEDEKTVIKEQAEEFKYQINGILEQIDEEEAETKTSLEVLTTLESTGEKIGEGKNIALDRMAVMNKCREHLSIIADKLETALPGNNAGEHALESNLPTKSVEEYNKMLDDSVAKHGEMLKNSHFMSKEEKDLEHAKYAEAAERAKKEYADNVKEQHGDNKIENGYKKINSNEIKGLDISDESFWSYKSTEKEKYLDMASKIPDVERGLQSGMSMEKLRENPELKDTIDAYYDANNMITVEKDSEGYHFQDSGRHRVAAARELGIDIPIKVVERGQV